MKNNKILILAAHPDDETLGCGGVIKKFSMMGADIKVVFFSDGETSRKIVKNKIKSKIEKRKNNSIKALKVLGCTKYEYLNYPDNRLYSVDHLDLIKKIEITILNFKPTIVFTHYFNDLNIDHSIISKATTTACRPAKFKFLKQMYYYHVQSSTDWNFTSNSNFKPNSFFDISKTFKFKKKALLHYKSELLNKHPRSINSVKSFLQYNGSLIGVDYAEPFILAFSKK